MGHYIRVVFLTTFLCASASVLPPVEMVTLPQVDISIEQPKIDTFAIYAERIAHDESGGDPKAVKSTGSYVGLYQIGDLAFKDIGWKMRVQDIRRNPSIFSEEVQLKALRAISKKNESYLAKHIAQYSGEIVRGVKITKYGILASAHLVGARKVKRFLSYGELAYDGNGVPVTHFMKRMEDL